jgi:hypothetical protein
MKSLYLRVWAVVVLTLALGAAVARLGWGISSAKNAASLAIIILLLVAIISSYALVLYIAIKPSLKKLKSLPVSIMATVIAGGGIAGCIIHFIRFVSSPRASTPVSVSVASLLLASGVVLCALILWVVWRFRGRVKGDE